MRDAIERIEREALPVEDKLRHRTIANAPVQVEKASGGRLERAVHGESDGPAGGKDGDAPDTRTRKAVQGSTPLVVVSPSSQHNMAASNMRWNRRGSAGAGCRNTPATSYSFQAASAWAGGQASPDARKHSAITCSVRVCRASKPQYTSSNRT